MSTFRLQTFDAAGGGDTREGSGPSAADLALQAARDEGYQQGFLAGQAAATEAHLEDQGRLTGELVEALSDAGLTNEAARRHVAASLAPMIEALGAAIAPSLAEAGMTAEVARLVELALEASPAARPLVRCAEELAGPLAKLLDERGIAADVEAAPEFLPREARIVWDQGYDHIDMDACVAQVRQCLASHLKTESGSVKHDGF